MHGFLTRVSEMWWLGLCIPVVFVVASVPVYVRRMTRHAAGWREVAADRGLECSVEEGLLALFPMRWSLQGSIDGARVEVKTVQDPPSSGRRLLFTRSAVTLEGELPAGLSLRVERLSDKLARVFGADDVEVGDPDLDRRLVIRTRDPAHARALLRQPSVKAALCALADGHPSFKVEGGAAFIDHASILSDPDALANEIDRLVALARGVRAGT